MIVGQATVSLAMDEMYNRSLTRFIRPSATSRTEP
jgi:hypothetical protein